MVTLAKPKPSASKPAAKPGLAVAKKPAAAAKPALAKPKADKPKEPTVSFKVNDVAEFVKYEKAGDDPIFVEGDRIILVTKEKDKDSGLTFFGAIKEEDYAQYQKNPEDVAGDQVFPTEIKKAEKREIDPYAMTVVRNSTLDEIIGTEDPLDVAKSLQEDAARNVFYMGGVLQLLYADRAYLKYDPTAYADDTDEAGAVVKGSGWDKFCQENFSEGGRKCSSLMTTYRAFASVAAEGKVELDLDTIATNKKIGWVKLAYMAPHVTSDNVEALIESAETKNVTDFKDEVKTDYVNASAEARSGNSAAKVKRTTLKIVLFEDQAPGVQFVLEQVMKELGTDQMGPALERIVMDWASQFLNETTFKKARKQSRDKLKELEKSGVDVKDRKASNTDLDDYLTRHDGAAEGETAPETAEA